MNKEIEKYELARKILFDILFLNKDNNNNIQDYCKKNLEFYRLKIFELKTLKEKVKKC